MRRNEGKVTNFLIKAAEVERNNGKILVTLTRNTKNWMNINIFGVKFWRFSEILH